MDSIIDHRIEAIVPFSQAQGGGKSGSSPCDHLFLLRAVMTISEKRKAPVFLTFWDVSKAYDHVDNSDLLVTMWDNGLRGRVWRLLKELNSNLTAEVKTRYGPTREIEMQIGGKQGSRLTGRMFSKMMDLLTEELEQKGIKITEEFFLAVLLWVDDVISFAEGEEDQREILQIINNFAIKHKIQWGQAKCKVMRIGKHKENNQQWRAGDMVIEETDRYKYLGDVITNDGKNKENILTRKINIQSNTAIINSIASSEALYRIETAVLLDMHEKKNIASLLNNAEAWMLNKGEEDDIEKVEIQALKSLFSLPLHTPTAAIIYTFGTLFTKQRIDQKMLIYLHKLLNKDDDRWLKQALSTLCSLNAGWYKKIISLLEEYELLTDFNEIKKLTEAGWRSQVIRKIEKANKERLIQSCYKTVDGVQTPKTKTQHMARELDRRDYIRAPDNIILKTTKSEAKTIIMARYGMLQCGKNFKGTDEIKCKSCDVIDDENHRLNYCTQWKDINLLNSDITIDFQNVFSNDIETLRMIIPYIQKVWNVKNANGTMHTE